MPRSVFALLLVGLPAVVIAQQPSAMSAPPTIGSFALGDECQLEVAPVAADSVRLQLLCHSPPPLSHVGFLDERLPWRADTVQYERRAPGSGNCRIRVRFTDADAIVTQEGRDAACGFGFGVSANGTYRRTSRLRPAFDLNPIGEVSDEHRDYSADVIVSGSGVGLPRSP